MGHNQDRVTNFENAINKTERTFQNILTYIFINQSITEATILLLQCIYILYILWW